MHVVTQAIDKEVRGAAVPAQDDLVAVALALRDHRAGDIAKHVGDRAHRLVVNLRLGDDRGRLRNVLETGRCAGGGACRIDLVAVPDAGDDDCLAGVRSRNGWLTLSRCGHGHQSKA